MIQKHVLKLEAYLQEEKGAQGRLLALLEAQEKAVVEGDTSALEITGAELEQELAGEPRRERRRREILNEIGRALGVPVGILTVRSLAERLGPDGERLMRLRDELREALVAVRRKSGRVAAIARGQRDIVRDVMCLLFGEPDEAGRGALVNTEA